MIERLCKDMAEPVKPWARVYENNMPYDDGYYLVRGNGVEMPTTWKLAFVEIGPKGVLLRFPHYPGERPMALMKETIEAGPFTFTGPKRIRPKEAVA